MEQLFGFLKEIQKTFETFDKEDIKRLEVKRKKLMLEYCDRVIKSKLLNSLTN